MRSVALAQSPDARTQTGAVAVPRARTKNAALMTSPWTTPVAKSETVATTTARPSIGR